MEKAAEILMELPENIYTGDKMFDNISKILTVEGYLRELMGTYPQILAELQTNYKWVGDKDGTMTGSPPSNWKDLAAYIKANCVDVVAEAIKIAESLPENVYASDMFVNIGKMVALEGFLKTLMGKYPQLLPELQANFKWVGDKDGTMTGAPPSNWKDLAAYLKENCVDPLDKAIEICGKLPENLYSGDKMFANIAALLELEGYLKKLMGKYPQVLTELQTNYKWSGDMDGTMSGSPPSNWKDLAAYLKATCVDPLAESIRIAESLPENVYASDMFANIAKMLALETQLRILMPKNPKLLPTLQAKFNWTGDASGTMTGSPPSTWKDLAAYLKVNVKS